MQRNWQQQIGLSSKHLQSMADSRGNQCQISKAVAPDLAKLLSAATDDGIPIVIVSGYRSFERQLAIWNRKWHGEQSILDQQGRPLEVSQLSDEEKFLAICHWSALPGLSRHHWGTDLDIFDAAAIDSGHKVELVPEEFAADGPCGELEIWLQQNLARFGFYRPYRQYRGGVAAEPWHISHQSESAQMLAHFDYPACRDYLRQSGIAGMETIDIHYNDYVEQFFTNLCEAPD